MMPRIFVLTVDRPIQRFTDTAAHLDSLGIKWERFDGMDNQITKLLPVDTFDLDRVGERIGPKHIAATLSHYLVWKVMSYQPDDYFIVFEYDVRVGQTFDIDFRLACDSLPNDWDVCFLGSCCCEGRTTNRVDGPIYEVHYPLCGHAIMYRKKALPILLREHQRISMPLDIAMFYQSLPKLRVYTVLPPLVTQHGTPLPP